MFGGALLFLLFVVWFVVSGEANGYLGARAGGQGQTLVKSSNKKGGKPTLLVLVRHNMQQTANIITLSSSRENKAWRSIQR